ncbi:TlyA family RNA methyltransferase [bacterium]|nr:TlyA family RNA methyltransferase [bacterium]MCK4436503.1 TlyA family RNA methyltransferase [bacterium]
MKERLDKVLVERGLSPTREKAKREALAGSVLVDGKRADKPGRMVSARAEIEIKEPSCPYVSRGGLKLEKALQDFGIEVKNKVAVDIGASTGGFTDCLLQNGVKKVYAVDVGYGQLAWNLRRDGRVVNLERKNARYLCTEDLGEKPELATIDVSFISLDKIIPVISSLLNGKGEILALIKPQFEVGRGKVGKGGVVRKEEFQKEAISKVANLAEELKLKVCGITASPLRGPAGNREFFIHLSKDRRSKKLEDLETLVESQWAR